MKLYYMKQKALDSLQNDIDANLEKYQSETPWIHQYFIDKGAPMYYFDTGIDIPDFKLEIGGPETDFQNSKIVYEAFKGHINPVQASDIRLWAYLAHTQHWDYMFNRWKIDIPDEEEDEEKEGKKKTPREKTLDRVKTRYFFGASRGKAFVRQGISRLFWSAYLTFDEENDNPYEYTEFFFNKQDIFTSITERAYARNKVLVLAALRELKKYPELSREEIRLFLAKLNQAGAITVLDFLDANQAGALCKKLMDEVHQVPYLKEGSIFVAYNNLTGKPYSKQALKIVNGRINGLALLTSTKPKNLIGRKEGSKFEISGQTFVIREIQ